MNANSLNVNSMNADSLNADSLNANSMNANSMNANSLRSRAVFTRFCIMQAAYWSFNAALPSYITAYMLSCGMNASTLGYLLAVYLFCALGGSLFWGRWIDIHHASRRFFLFGNVFACALGILLFIFVRQPVILFIAYPLFGFMSGPIATTLDAWVIASFPERGDAVSRSRSFATLGYAFVMLLMGQLIVKIGYQAMPVAALAFMAVNFITALFQPEAPFTEDGGGASRPDPKELLSSRLYLLLAASVFFTGMCIAPINNLKVLLFENVGGNVSYLGWDNFIGCLIQIPFLMFAGKLRFIRAEKRLLAGSMAAMFYALFVLAAKSPGMIIAGTMMNNISFGLLFPTMREMTERFVHPRLRNTAHSMIDVAYGSFSGMIASSFSGRVLESSGSTSMCMICVCMELIAIAIAFFLIFSCTMRKPQRLWGKFKMNF
ncbi:MAG: MFS transporter [Lachnospiraceae bacterium]|nr:MFS transporter [Lachnospiraceae bacterium]